LKAIRRNISGPFQAIKELKFRALKVISVFVSLKKKRIFQVPLIEFCGFMSGKKKNLSFYVLELQHNQTNKDSFSIHNTNIFNGHSS